MNRALLIGINEYPGNELRGCVNDVTDMAAFLVSKCGFQEDEVRLLVDARATTSAILERLNWLLAGTQAGDRVLLHYSGHGARFPMRDVAGQVVRVDECICPVDFDWSVEHAIRDKQFYEIFSGIKEDAEVIFIADSCFSGDLARAVLPKGQRPRIMPAPPDIDWRVQTARAKGIGVPGFVHVIKNFHVALVSGCTAKQTSADVSFGPDNDPRYNGALTHFLLNRLSEDDGLSALLQPLVGDVGKRLKEAGFEQRPQLEGSDDLMNHPFLWTGVPGQPTARA